MDFNEKYIELAKEKILSISRGMEGDIFIFGSRARGDFDRDSDLDIGCLNMSIEDFRRLEREFCFYWEESDIPYELDLVDFSRADARFRKIAEKDRIIWKND